MLFLAAILLAAVLFLYTRPWRHIIMGWKIPGPTAYPIVGNALQVGTDSADMYSYTIRTYKKFYGSAFALWAGPKLNVVLTLPDDIEILLKNKDQLTKSSMYKYFRPWLGDSLITNTGTRWQQVRKLLAPMFHVKMLESFIDSVHNYGEIFVENLLDKVGGKEINIHHYACLNAVDNMGETFMGMKINAQKDADSEYAKAVQVQLEIVARRFSRPWLQPDVLFNLTELKRRETKSLALLHSVTDNVIARRRAEMTLERATKTSGDVAEEQTTSYLDALIESTFQGSGLTDEDIRGEICTVGFAGHDTTATCMSFALYSLAWNQHIQDMVVEELKAVWPDTSEKPTFRQLQELEYLDRVIKETLRLYPSLPCIGRTLNEDTEFTGGLVVPRGADVLLMLHLTHRDPNIYPDPERFDPDRFLPENVKNRHPYSYTPFSMGVKNCPAGKFAMLELRCTMAQLLRKFRFLPGSGKQELKLSIDAALAAHDGVSVKLELRE